jgi:hypothetical protein
MEANGGVLSCSARGVGGENINDKVIRLSFSNAVGHQSPLRQSGN